MSTVEKKVDTLIRLLLSNDETEAYNHMESLRKMMGESVDAPVPVPVNYRAKVARALTELGTPDHIKGHKYLVHALCMVIEHPEYIEQVTCVLYPEVAKKYDTTASRVERAIRHAIEVTWDRANLDVLYNYFGNTVSAIKGKPTNSEFIARMANELR